MSSSCGTPSSSISLSLSGSRARVRSAITSCTARVPSPTKLAQREPAALPQTRYPVLPPPRCGTSLASGTHVRGSRVVTPRRTAQGQHRINSVPATQDGSPYSSLWPNAPPLSGPVASLAPSSSSSSWSDGWYSGSSSSSSNQSNGLASAATGDRSPCSRYGAPGRVPQRGRSVSRARRSVSWPH